MSSGGSNSYDTAPRSWARGNDWRWRRQR